MARTAITATTVPKADSDGYNLTDSADFSTLATGSGNGVEFPYDREDLIILKNDTGGAAVFTIVSRPNSNLTDQGGSVTEPTVTVAAGKTHLLAQDAIFEQSDGNTYIDCDVAGKVLILDL